MPVRPSGLVVCHHPLLHPVQVFRTLVQNAGFITHDHVGETVGQQQFGNGNACASGTVDYDLAVLFLPAGDFQGIDGSGQHHDGGAVLVIVEHRDVQLCFQPFFDLKTAGRGDILQIDAAKARGNGFHHADDLLGVLGVQTDRHGIHAAELLEQAGTFLP